MTDSATFTTPEAGDEDLGDLLLESEKKLTHDPRYRWDREEHILLLNEYLEYTPHIPGKHSKEIEDISNLLRRYHQQKGNPIHEHLRNVNGVYMKLMNFRRFDPNTESKGLPKGNRLEGEIWEEYAENRSELRKIAELIKETILQGIVLSGAESEESLEMETEGRVIGTIHKRHERSLKNKQNKVKDFKRRYGGLFCEACQFDFEKSYGERGVDFCEVHHEIPISEMRPGYKTQIQDLRCVCANCHRIIHRRRPWLTVDEVKNLLEENKRLRKNG